MSVPPASSLCHSLPYLHMHSSLLHELSLSLNSLRVSPDASLCPQVPLIFYCLSLCKPRNKRKNQVSWAPLSSNGEIKGLRGFFKRWANCTCCRLPNQHHPLDMEIISKDMVRRWPCDHLVRGLLFLFLELLHNEQPDHSKKKSRNLQTDFYPFSINKSHCCMTFILTINNIKNFSGR